MRCDAVQSSRSFFPTFPTGTLFLLFRNSRNIKKEPRTIFFADTSYANFTDIDFFMSYKFYGQHMALLTAEKKI